MARLKRTSRSLEKAYRRAAGLLSISSDLDLGNELTLRSYQDKISEVRTKVDAYNTLLSNVDQAHNEMVQAEKEIDDLSSRMLSGVGVKYGRNSVEYEMAGGVRTSERKRPTKKTMSEPAAA